MSKYDKTQFTLTTLLEAHKWAIREYFAAVQREDKAAELRWHDECSRIEKQVVAKRKAADEAADAAYAAAKAAEEALAQVDLIKEFGGEPPVAADPLPLEDLWFKDGVAYGRTPSCGCCSEVYSSEVDEYDYDPKMVDLDRMAAYVEQQEAKVQALREDFNDYCNSQENG